MMPAPSDPTPADICPQDLAFLHEVVRRNIGLHATPPPPAQRLKEPAVRTRWKRWLRFGGAYDWRLLRRRMKAGGLRPAALYQPCEVHALPPWADTLQTLRALARQWADNPPDINAVLPAGAMAQPFADLMAPCLLLARQRLGARTATIPSAALAPTALAGLERALLQRLADIVGPSLLALFDTQRPNAPLLWALFDTSATCPDERYRAFVQAQWRQGYQALGEGWPVALRFMAELVDQWVDATAEFVQRLTQDYTALCSTFFPGTASPGLVVAVDATLSDPHAGGRTVLKLTFSHGQQLVYKPRPMAMERIFSDTLQWLNTNTAWSAQHPQLHVPQVLLRQDYGWMAWVAEAPMASGEEPLYHWRLGSLMAILRALQGCDMHQENLVAAGAHPVFVDVECLLHPSAQPFLELPIPSDTDQLPRELLHMGILPFYGSADNTHGMVNLGGIGKTAETRGPQTTIFRHVNSDWMHMTRDAMRQSTHHQPRTEAGWVNSFAHAETIAAGYRETLGFILAQREWLLTDAQSPWQDLRLARGRHLARNTWNYGLLMAGAVAPEAMTDGIMFDLTFEPLHRHLHLLSPGYRHMAPAEHRDLRHLDVPRFGFAADNLHLYDAHGRPLGDMHRVPPFSAMAEKLRSLQPNRVQWEADLLQLVLTEYSPPKDMSLAGLTSDLLRRHRTLDNGAVLWMGLGSQGDGISVHLMTPGLYTGTTGIALAVACASRVLQNTESAQLAVRVLNDSLTLLARPRPGGRPLPSPGYDQGMAGLLYAFDVCAHLTGTPHLKAKAHTLAQDWLAAFTPGEHTAPGQCVDLLNGVAGLLLVLLRWHRAHPQDPEFLRAACACGDHLLQQARTETVGVSWGESGSPGLSGLSHGSSGLAVALTALYRATGKRRYRAAAFEALDYETTLFVPEQANWRDLRGIQDGDSHQVQRCGCSWCHGAPGIALARAALLHLLADDLATSERAMLEAQMDRALATTCEILQHDTGTQLDDLCCGSAGCIDILLECARLLDRPALTEIARHEAQKRRQAWTTPGPEQQAPRYWFTRGDMAGTSLSLFKGITGQVYLQARLAAPHTIPCVLLPL